MGFLLKAHPRTLISITAQFYNTNIRILHRFSKANIKAEMTLWREILICPNNCIITLRTAYDTDFSLGGKKKPYVNLVIHFEYASSTPFSIIGSLVQN